MSAFSETALIKKLVELNPSQQSIQTLSLWLIHHRKHHSHVTKSWYNELHRGKFCAINFFSGFVLVSKNLTQRFHTIYNNFIILAPKNKKLTFMYLANDVIQNSKKKGPEYGKEFQKVLEKAFHHIGESCSSSDNKTISSLDRILKIWEDRMVYDSKTVHQFHEALHKNDSSHSPKTNPPEKRKRDVEETKRHKISKHDGSSRERERERERVKSETVEVNGAVETHVILSPRVNTGDPPGKIFY